MQKKRKKRKTLQEQESKAALAILYHPIYLQKKTSDFENKIYVAD